MMGDVLNGAWSTEHGAKDMGERYKASPGEIRSVVVNEFHRARVGGGEVAEDLFNRGLCLPSGTAMTEKDLDRVISVINRCKRK